MMTSKPLALYLHIPFCASKCPYCDFYSGRYPDETKTAYLSALKEEIKTLRRSAAFLPENAFDRPLSSVYFGGGTPSVLGAAALSDLLRAVRSRFSLLPDAEITAEVNPSVADPDRFFAALAGSGFNRVSIGMQSAVDEERKKLGRRAGKREVARCVDAAKRAGIGNISLDVMLGIPLQTEKSLVETLDFALSQNVPHLSCYLLKIEPGTPFFKMRDRLILPDDDTAADCYLLTCEYLKAHGMRHYEVSNFCFADKIGRHNMTYWTDGEYFGLGPGAHSFVGGVRFYQPPDLDAFLSGAPAEYEDTGGDEDEKRMLRLRTDLGTPVSAFPEKKALLSRLEQNGLLTLTDGLVRLTDRGYLVSNQVIGALLS